MEFGRERVLDFLGFEEGDCFESNDCSERVRFETQISALEAMLDESELAFIGNKDGAVREYLESMTLYLSVYAFKRNVIGEPARQQAAEWIVDLVRDNFCDEYGDYDGNDRMSDDAIVEFVAKSRELYDWYLSKVKVHNVERLRGWTFDKDDLLELVQQLRPSWLEKP